MNWTEFRSTLIAGTLVAAALFSMLHGLVESIATGSLLPAALFTAPPVVLLAAIRAGRKRRTRRT